LNHGLSDKAKPIKWFIQKLQRRRGHDAYDNYAEPPGVRIRDLARTRLVELEDEDEADLFATAFHRYVELHGRVVCDPDCRCMLEPVTSLRRGVQVRLATFWSPQAAAEFDRFWPDYRRVYGPQDHDAFAPVE
jgi:hypothetical protein